MGIQKRNSISFGISLLVLLVAVSASAQPVTRGSDAWMTPGNGSTSAFLTVPPGFFCAGDNGWSGSVVLQGVPVATNPPGAFGSADTIIERLGDAVFDATGTARVRIVVRGLNFAATQPISTACGDWSASVGLNGTQPITTMTIRLNNQGPAAAAPTGGTFTAPIAVNATWRFTNQTTGATTSLNTSNVLNSTIPTPWRYSPCPGVLVVGGTILVDTDNDGVPDTPVQGNSNFFPGLDELCRRLQVCRDKNIDPVKHCYVLTGQPIDF